MSRIPSLKDVAALDRDDWESLCACICGLVFNTHRVEDRNGKGNGLDAWRTSEGAVQGWQFRRLDDRLGDKQIAKLRENIALAASRAQEEFGAPLRTFCAILSIDPEPGHSGSRGEIERLRDLRVWASAQHTVAFEFHGVSWVYRHLLQNPWMRPDLFENLAASVNEAAEATRRLELQVTHLSARIDANLEGQLKAKLDVLLREAELHHGRALEFGQTEEYLRAIASWEDALRLVRGHGGAVQFEGKILSILGGVQVLVGRLAAANENSRRAVSLLDPTENKEHYWWALGNLAFGLTHAQQYLEAERCFVQVLAHYEREGDIREVARTVQQRIELAVQLRRAEEIGPLVERLIRMEEALVSAEGPSDLTIGFLGTVGNAYKTLADTSEGEVSRTLRAEAMSTFERLERFASEVGLKRLALMARGQIGDCLWRMDRLDEAEVAMKTAVASDDGTFGKVVADVQFNRGLVLGEMRRWEDARASLTAARDRYRELGDRASEMDAEEQLRRLRSGA